jgi:PAS domain S-box-containing protein
MTAAKSAQTSPFSAIKGEMAERVRAFDWAATPLGPISQWPQSLKTAVGMVLQSPVPIVMLWGEDGIMIYNDGYSEFAGQRHPALLGSKVREGWPEVADFNDNIMKVGLAGGTLAYHDFVLNLNRTGTFEPVWLDLDYSPIPDESGKPAGVMGIVVEITKRVSAERAQAEANERLRLATENAEVGLWDIDRDGNISFFYARSAFSMPQDRKTPAEEFFTHVHPEDVSALLSAYRAARDPEKRAMLDVEYRTLAVGNIPARWMAVKGRGVFDADGACVRMSGTAVDITKRKRAEQALRHSEEQLRLATENAEIGMWDMDVANNVNYSTPRVKAMFGINSSDDPPSEDFFKLIHPNDIARVEKAYALAFDPELRGSYDVEYRAIGRDDGVERWIHAKGRGIFDADGRCLRVSGTAVDITEKHKTEDALRRSEEQLRLAAEHADVGLWDVDVVNQLLYWPPRVNAMFGLAPDHPTTLKEFRARIHPDDRRRVVGAMLEACDPAKKTPYDVEYRIVRASGGAIRWVSVRGRAVFDADDRCTRMLGVIIDITPRKQIEERLLELNETLEARVAERTAQLERSQQALQQVQKMEAIGNLTGGIAHDFNNLLQGVSGSLDLIRRRPDDPARVRQWAEAGLQASERGAKLTAQLLAFSRSQKLQLKPIDLTELLLGMRDLLGRTLGPAVHITINPEAEAANVMGDETQLELALLNLAINARDAMPNGGELVIATHKHQVGHDADLAPGDYIELAVADSGTGMPADVIARAFDPFFTTKGVGKGTGLGLSQVYGMARQAGGIARLVSKPGEGTTVRIFLKTTNANPQRDAARDEGGQTHAQKPAVILIVDDDVDVRRFLGNSLDALGYQVVQAENGAEGLAALARATPDMVIVDYAMPGMTGTEMAQKARVTHPSLPIVFASGYAETSALETVAVDKTLILRKPFRINELQDAVARALALSLLETTSAHIGDAARQADHRAIALDD